MLYERESELMHMDTFFENDEFDTPEMENNTKKANFRYYFSKKQLLLYMKDDKLIVKRISYTFDDKDLKKLDSELGIVFEHVEREHNYNTSPFLVSGRYISEISDEYMDFETLVSFYNHDKERLACILKEAGLYQNSDGQIYRYDYSLNFGDKKRILTDAEKKGYSFRYKHYIQHSKILSLIEFSKKRLDLDYIYRNLCNFLGLKYNNYFCDIPMSFDPDTICYDSSFNDKEMSLDDNEKKELLSFLFKHIKIDDFCEVKFSDINIMDIDEIDIACRNTQILNDESFRTIMNYTNVEKVKTKLPK